VSSGPPDGSSYPSELLAIAPTTSQVKRTLDVIVSLTGTAVLVVLWPVVALAIRLESRGPVFSRQLLVGIQRRRPGSMERGVRRVHDTRGEAFTLWSFRVTDPRSGKLTFVGGLLRATAIERLPRLVSVLRGHMSLVGPRASTGEFVDEVHRICPAISGRLGHWTPGLFGAAQLRGPESGAFFESLYEKLYVERCYGERLERCGGLDVLVLDLSILLRSLLGLRPRREAEMVQVEYPTTFAVLPLELVDVEEMLPTGAGSEEDTENGVFGIHWQPTARRPEAWPEELGEETLEVLCDDVLQGPDRLELGFALHPGGRVGTDLVNVELGRGLGAAGGVCEHLNLVWDALQDRVDDEHFAWKANAALLEGLAFVVSRADPAARQVSASIEVDDRQLRMILEVLPVRSGVEAPVGMSLARSR